MGQFGMRPLPPLSGVLRCHDDGRRSPVTSMNIYMYSLDFPTTVARWERYLLVVCQVHGCCNTVARTDNAGCMRSVARHTSKWYTHVLGITAAAQTSITMTSKVPATCPIPLVYITHFIYSKRRIGFSSASPPCAYVYLHMPYKQSLATTTTSSSQHPYTLFNHTPAVLSAMGGFFSQMKYLRYGVSQSFPPKSKFSTDQIPDLTGRVVIVTGSRPFSARVAVAAFADTALQARVLG